MRAQSRHGAKAATPPAVASPTGASTSWRDRFTLIRMGVAFFFPWPFLTKNLEVRAERRARRRTGTS